MIARTLALAGVFVATALTARAQSPNASNPAAKSPRKIISLDDGWRFIQADPPGAENPNFDDSTWRTVNVPHDWSIEGEIDLRNPSGPDGAYLPMGVGWYRKILPPMTSPVTAIEFDGIMANASVYLNGKKIGQRPNGYSTVRYPLDTLNDKQNVLAVRADNSIQPSSRWYAGSGITRHVRLIGTSDVHLDSNQLFIHTRDANDQTATLQIDGTLAGKVHGENLHTWSLDVDLIDPTGASQSHRTFGLKVDTDFFSEKFTVPQPRLWGVGGGEHSPLYHAIIKLREDNNNGKIADDLTIPFGIRTAEFKPDGFFLNGKPTKLQGVCLHLDGGGVGAAVPMGVWERRLDALQSLGVNAIRTSHNPPDPAFLDLLDRKGFLVMHEIFDTWNTAKVRGDYARFFKDNWQQDLTDAITRDRNHPCIVIYSAGNEIHDSAAQQLALFPQLRDLYHQLDPTRPVTVAMLQADRPGGGFTNGLMQLQDVVGANYRGAQLVTLARANPGMKVIETETNYNAGTLATLRDNPELAGEFLWTGVDYLGEGMAPGGIAQGFGLVDRTGAIRARGYEHAEWWSTTPLVKIARVTGPGRVNNRDLGGGRVCDWTPAEPVASARTSAPQPQTIEVYSNCDDVELFLNGQSLGTKPKPATLTRTWQVPYAPGTISAIARNAGKTIATDELHSANTPTQILLTANRKTLTTAWDDVVYIRANIADDAGTTNPNATNLIHFTITGPGTLMAVDNADLDSHEPFRGNQRSAFQGTCIAVVKATGNGLITLRASADGLQNATITVTGEARP